MVKGKNKAISLRALLSFLVIWCFAPFQASASTATPISCDLLTDKIKYFVPILHDDQLIPLWIDFVPSGQCYKADLNGDGQFDILVQGQSPSDDSYIFLADSNGNYSTLDQRWANDYLGLDWSANTAQLDIEDLNGDGRADILLTSSQDPLVSAQLLTNSRGTISNSQITWIDTSTGANISETYFGKSAGSFSVSGGSANYNIPVDVPPGMAGMEPSVSLNYGGGGLNGLAGVSWSIGGLSQINRCATSLAQDGFIDPVDYDSNDQFCLDGQRLVTVSDDSCDSGCTAIYRTEIDSFYKIESFGSTTDPSYFAVRTQSGQTKYYGKSTDSRIEAQGRIEAHTWNISKVQDTAGNYLTYSYHEDNTNGYYRINRIDYTGNVSGGLLPTASVVFEFESRPDTTNGYMGGSIIKMLERLRNIKTYVGNGGTLVRQYKLSYDNSGIMGLSRLVGFQECDANVNCKLKGKNTWQYGGEGSFNPVTNGLNTSINSSAVTASIDISRLKWGDFNGDGVSDIYYVVGWGGAEWDQIYFGSIDGTYGAGINALQTFVNDSHTGAPVDISRIKLIDLNGDGMTDVYIMNGWGGSAVDEVHLSKGDGTFEPVIDGLNTFINDSAVTASIDISRLKMSDFNGDGITDIYYVTGWGATSWDKIHFGKGDGTFESGVNALPTFVNDSHSGAPVDISRIRFSDFNGDGMADIYYMNGWGGDAVDKIYLSKGDGTFKPGIDGLNTFINNSAETASIDMSRINMGDFNGDGIIDIYYILGWGTTSWDQIYFGKGDGTFAPGVDALNTFVNNSSTGAPVDIARLRFADINGDGMTDVYNMNGWGDSAVDKIYLSKGDGTFLSAIDGLNTYIGGNAENATLDMSRLSLTDLNGDGITDIYYMTGWGGAALDNVYIGVTKNQLITKIETGIDSSIEINHGLLTDSAVYTKHTDANNAAGYIDIQPPMQVVTGYTKSDGIGGRYSYSYRYAGLKSHRLGYGSMGFANVTMIDNETGIESNVYNHQVYPLHNKQDYDVTSLGNTTISYTKNTWLHHKTHNNKITVLQMLSTYSYAKEINSNLVVKQTTNTNAYDAYNNITRITINSHDGYQKITDNVYYPPDIYKWHTGRLQRSSVTNYTPTGTAPARSSRFEYDSITGLLTKEVIEPNNPDFYKETSYTYDAFGNKETITVKGHSAAKYPIATRVTQSRYIPNTIGTLNPVIETSNNLGHTETKTYDARFGNVVSLTGPNGLTTDWEFDSFGRQTREIRADGTYTEQTYNYCVTNCAYGSKVSVTTQDFGNNHTTASPPSTVFFDSSDRELISTTIGFDGQAICKENHYDHFGRVSKASQPYFAPTKTSCNYGSNSHKYTSMQYDVLGRLTNTTMPDSSYIRTEYNGLETTTINDYEQRTTQLKNSQDQLIRVTDDSGNSTHYTFDPYGNMTEVKDAAGNITKLIYNLAGQKIEMIDPDMGRWFYENNALGELKKQTNAKGHVVTMQYDTLGRLVQKVTPEAASTWTYDPPGALGQLDTVSMTGLSGYSRSVNYDSFIRPTAVSTRFNGSTYAVTTAYDSTYSRVTSTTYPGITPFSVNNNYTANGFLKEIRDSSNALYWKLDTVNAQGQTTKETYGNGIVHVRTYDDHTGRIATISTGAGSTTAQSLSYQFDTLGNLVQRTDERQGITEESDYDNLSRLTATFVSGNITSHQNTYVYDSIGNITFKSDVGSYLYGQNNNGSHQVTSAGGVSYDYDANGNQVTGDGRTITYTSFNKPLTVAKGATTNTYGYDADQNRIHKVSVNGGGTTSTFYLGKSYEKITRPSGVVEHTYYLGAGSATVKITRRTNGANDTRYMHTDHIGSIDAITDENGLVVEQNSFSAWGQRRYANWQQPINQIIASLTTRGFTGHEMEDEIGLINMNARLYDPRLGRFLQADTIVQFPESTQGFNRYTYVNNNPLSYTDPTGHSLVGDIFNVLLSPLNLIVDIHQKLGDELKRFFIKHEWARQVGSVAAAWFGGPLGAALFQGYLVQIQGGSWSDVGKAMVISFASSYAYGKIGDGLAGAGEAAPTLSPAEGVFLHGMVGGAAADASGGSFKDGFVGAAVGKMMTLGTAAKMPVGPGQFIMTTMGGGIAAELGGGKFADGASSAAMGYIFNAAAHAQKGLLGRGVDKLKAFGQSVVDEVAFGANAVANGVSEDYQAGGILGVIIGATGGPTDQSFFGQIGSNYASTSLIVGPINNLDKTLTSIAVGGAITRTYGGYSFGQLLLRGPAPHLGTYGASARLAVGTTLINSAVIAVSYEGGNLAGSTFRAIINRSARALK